MIEAILATLPPPDPNDPASLRRALALGSTYAAHLEADLRSRDGHPFGLRDRLRQFLRDNASTRDVSAWARWPSGSRSRTLALLPATPGSCRAIASTIRAVSIEGNGWTWAQIDTVPDAHCVE